MSAPPDIDEIHLAIGEFVVFFQSVEDMYRQLGWQLVDPERKAWPPLQFRKESNQDLINKVTDLFVNLTKEHNFANGQEMATKAESLRSTFHALRTFRNRMVHSAYHEVKSGYDVVAILRTNPRITVDPDTGEIEYDQETFDPNTIRDELGRHVQAFFQLHSLRMQAIHWHPYTKHASDEVGKPVA